MYQGHHTTDVPKGHVVRIADFGSPEVLRRGPNDRFGEAAPRRDPTWSRSAMGRFLRIRWSGRISGFRRLCAGSAAQRRELTFVVAPQRANNPITRCWAYLSFTVDGMRFLCTFRFTFVGRFKSTGSDMRFRACLCFGLRRIAMKSNMSCLCIVEDRAAFGAPVPGRWGIRTASVHPQLGR